MKTSNLQHLFQPRRVNRHQTDRPYPRSSRFKQFRHESLYPLALIIGGPLLVVAAISGWLDSVLAPVFGWMGL